MQNWRKKLEAVFSAVTFAEVGEYETALSCLSAERGDGPEKSESKARARERDLSPGESLKQRLEDHLAAVAFAEAGEFETAVEMLPRSRKRDRVLLAIEGEVPTPSTFDYALSLCKRIDADMDILQMIL